MQVGHSWLFISYSGGVGLKQQADISASRKHIKRKNISSFVPPLDNRQGNSVSEPKNVFVSGNLWQNSTMILNLFSI